MAAPVYGQWICHSPNVMKTDIFAGTDGAQEWQIDSGEYQI